MSLIEIMYADDDREDLEIFSDAVNRLVLNKTSNISLRTFGSGAALIKGLKNKKANPTIVLLDINMPTKNGFQTLKEIKSDQNLKAVPVIIYSTSNSKTSIDISYDLGADLYITKPSDFLVLMNIIEKLATIDFHTFAPNPDNFVLNPDNL